MEYQGLHPVAQRVKNPPAVQETWVWSLCQEDPLEEGMVTQFSILTWRIPWTEEPCELQSMESQRIRHTWGTKYKEPQGYPGALVVKNLPANAGDVKDSGSIPGPGRSPGERNGNPLSYSSLENPKNRGAWQATVHSVSESDTTGWLSTHSLKSLRGRLMLGSGRTQSPKDSCLSSHPDISVHHPALPFSFLHRWIDALSFGRVQSIYWYTK